MTTAPLSARNTLSCRARCVSLPCYLACLFGLLVDLLMSFLMPTVSIVLGLCKCLPPYNRQQKHCDYDR